MTAITLTLFIIGPPIVIVAAALWGLDALAGWLHKRRQNRRLKW